METKSGRSSRVSNRSTASSRLSGPDVNLLLERISAMQANMGAIHADMQLNMGALQADMQANIGAVQENICAAQVGTREVLETVIHRLQRLEASPVPKFVAGLDLNPSLSNEMTVAPTHSTISLEVKQGNPEVSTTPVVLSRSERLVNKPNLHTAAHRPRTAAPRLRVATHHCQRPRL